MVTISTFVFLDLETTGLPYKEYNKTKITELSVVATSRLEIDGTLPGGLPPVSKLSFFCNPDKKIQKGSSDITGLTNEYLQRAPLFRDRVKVLISFLENLPKPVCLVAHNGHTFDYKILLVECMEANVVLPQDLLCVDSLIGFRNLFKNIDVVDFAASNITCSSPKQVSDLLTDDEDEWPQLNVTPEEFQEIDDLCSRIQNISHIDDKQTQTNKTPKSKGHGGCKKIENFQLTTIYKTLLKKEPLNAHRAEVDCLMLLECVVAFKSFLGWADNNCKFLNQIKPLQRRSTVTPKLI